MVRGYIVFPPKLITAKSRLGDKNVPVCKKSSLDFGNGNLLTKPKLNVLTDVNPIGVILTKVAERFFFRDFGS